MGCYGVHGSSIYFSLGRGLPRVVRKDLGEDLISKLIFEGASDWLEKKGEEKKVWDPNTRNKENTAYGRGTPNSQAWLGVGGAQWG